MVCMKSISLSLVACVEFSYYISVTVSPAQKPVWGYWIIKQYQKQTKYYFISAANGVRLHKCSGLDTGVELERFHSNSFKNIIRTMLI